MRRGERLGAVGNSGWAMSPTLHYEYWRRTRAGVAPTDPRFAVLDRKLIDDGMSSRRCSRRRHPIRESPARTVTVSGGLRLTAYGTPARFPVSLPRAYARSGRVSP